MVGDGPDRGPAEQLVRQLKLTPHVSFLGKQNHVERLIPLAHVLTMPSEMESFGLVALEAMACGVATVATNVGGVPELIAHGVNGFLEPVGDIAAQASRVVELLTNEDLYRRITAAGRARAVEQFSTDRIIPQYEEYYREVTAK
jgi:glycosyltransferase involved in cell wall biosynthesis